MMKTKLLTMTDSLRNRANALKLAAVTTALTVGPAMVSLAAEGSSGTNLLTGELMTTLESGVTDLKATGAAVISVVVVAAIGLLGLSKGSDFALKKIKGVLNKAS